MRLSHRRQFLQLVTVLSHFRRVADYEGAERIRPTGHDLVGFPSARLERFDRCRFAPGPEVIGSLLGHGSYRKPYRLRRGRC